MYLDRVRKMCLCDVSQYIYLDRVTKDPALMYPSCIQHCENFFNISQVTNIYLSGVLSNSNYKISSIQYKNKSQYTASRVSKSLFAICWK